MIIGLILYFVIKNKEILKGKNLLSIICLVPLGTLTFDILFSI